jgi:hypothetical protein
MRIDPKGTLAGYPALFVRRALWRLDLYVEWDLGRFEAATGEGQALLKALAAGTGRADSKGFLVDHASGESNVICDSRPTGKACDGREGTGRVPGARARGLRKPQAGLPRQGS